MKRKVLLGILVILLGVTLVGCEKEEKFLTEDEIIYFQAQEYKQTNITTTINKVLYGSDSLEINGVKYLIEDKKLKIGDEKTIGIKKEEIVSIIGHEDFNGAAIYALTKKGKVYYLRNTEFAETKLKNIKRLIMLDTYMSTPGDDDNQKEYLIYAESKGNLYNVIRNL